MYDDDPTFQELQRAAKVRNLAVFVSNRDRRLGQRCIYLQQFGFTLGEFYEPEDALAWLTAGEGRE